MFVQVHSIQELFQVIDFGLGLIALPALVMAHSEDSPSAFGTDEGRFAICVSCFSVRSLN